MAIVEHKQMYLTDNEHDLICPICNDKLSFCGWTGSNPDSMTDRYICPICGLRAFDDGNSMSIRPREKFNYGSNYNRITYPLVTIYIDSGYTRIETNSFRTLDSILKGYKGRHHGSYDKDNYTVRYLKATKRYIIHIVDYGLD